MSYLKPRRPSPALLISILALFVALGGTAYATSQIGTSAIKKNAITAAKIKKNAVTSAKIKNGAVTSAKLKNGSVTGEKIDAATMPPAPVAKEWSRYFTTGVKKASVGQNVTLATIGPFTFTGKCINEAPGVAGVRTVVTTSQPGSFAVTGESKLTEANFNPGAELVIGGTLKATAVWQQTAGFTAASPDGGVILSGTAGMGVNVFGANCAFSLTWINQA